MELAWSYTDAWEIFVLLPDGSPGVRPRILGNPLRRVRSLEYMTLLNPLEVWGFFFLQHTVTPYAVVILYLSLFVDIVEQYLLFR